MTDLSGPILTGAFGFLGAAAGGAAALLGPVIAAKRERALERNARVRELLPQWIANLFGLRENEFGDEKWAAAAERATLLESQIAMLLASKDKPISKVLQLARGVRKLPTSIAFVAVMDSLSEELPRWVRGEQTASATLAAVEADIAPWREDLERKGP